MRRPEEAIHIAVATALKRSGVRFFHPPNEGRAHVTHRVKLRKMGLSKGVPDLIIVDPPPVGGFVGAALEIKSKTGSPTPEQRAWILDLERNGWAAAIAKGREACFNQLRAWGYLQ